MSVMPCAIQNGGNKEGRGGGGGGRKRVSFKLTIGRGRWRKRGSFITVTCGLWLCRHKVCALAPCREPAVGACGPPHRRSNPGGRKTQHKLQVHSEKPIITR